jgi:hypothetical protein
MPFAPFVGTVRVLGASVRPRRTLAVSVSGPLSLSDSARLRFREPIRRRRVTLTGARIALDPALPAGDDAAVVALVD